MREWLGETPASSDQKTALTSAWRRSARCHRRERDELRRSLWGVCPESRRLPLSPARHFSRASGRIQTSLRQALDLVADHNRQLARRYLPPSRPEIVDSFWILCVLHLRRQAYRAAIRVAEGNRRRWRKQGWNVRPSPYLNEREWYERTTLEIARRHFHSQQRRRAERASRSLRALNVAAASPAA